MANRIDDDKLTFLRHIMVGRMSDVDLFRWRNGTETRLVAKKSVVTGANFEHEQRLRYESSLAASFDHENIVKIFGYTHSRSGFGLVMDYYPYGSYQRAFIDSNVELRRQEDDHAKLFPLKMRILREIVSAMEYLHCEYMNSRRLLHLDLKAGNVLLDMQFHAKVSDFGISMLKTATHLRSQHSVRENRPITSVDGTLLFVSPERLFGPIAEASTKSDVYSFGILAWQILTDAYPYEGECGNNIKLIIYRVAHQDLRPKLDKIPDCVPRMMTNDVVVTCWSRDVEQRPEFSRIHNLIHSIINAQEDFVARITDAVAYAKEIVPEQEVDEPLHPIQQDARGGFNTLLWRMYLNLRLKARDLKTWQAIIVPILAILYICYIAIPTNCGPIVRIENGIANCGDDSKNTSVGTVCKFSCSERYSLEGPDEITCTENGTWTQSAPICTMITCLVLNSPLMGKVSCSDDNIVGSECTFSCDERYRLKGPDEITCTKNGTWTQSVPICTLVTCPILNRVPMGKVICSGDNNVGSECTFSCDVRYRLKGPDEITCTENGTWTQSPPLCAMVTCPVINKPTKGKVSCSDDNKVGSECSFSCDENHQIKGPDKITCGLDGSWSGKLPQCSLVQCEPPAAVKYGKITCRHTKEDYAVGSVCTVDCLQHHMVKGENGVVCESSGKWSQDLPSCECDNCRTGENCEKTTSWEVFRKDINRHGGTSHLDFAGHAITCEISDKGFHGWDWKYRCRCRDVNTGHVVDCGMHLGRYGSCERTSAEMIRQMVGKNEYPKACDAEKLARVQC